MNNLYTRTIADKIGRNLNTDDIIVLHGARQAGKHRFCIFWRTVSNRRVRRHITSTLSLLLLLLSVVVFSCQGSDSHNDNDIDRRVEQFITIQHGIYGQATSVSDVGASNPQYLTQFEIRVYTAAQYQSGGNPDATVLTSSVGFFEVPLSDGDFFLCTSYMRCTHLTISNSELKRCDFEAGPGPGWGC
jgi:hypothetical protein